MGFFRPPNHPQNDPRTLPDALWTPKWPCDPPWGLPGRLFGPQSRPKSTPKAAQEPPKSPYGAKMVDSNGHFVPQSRPKSFLKHPKAPIVRQNLKLSPPNHQFSLKIDDFQPFIVHRRPTDVQRTSPNMGRRQCYAHHILQKMTKCTKKISNDFQRITVQLT